MFALGTRGPALGAARGGVATLRPGHRLHDPGRHDRARRSAAGRLAHPRRGDWSVADPSSSLAAPCTRPGPTATTPNSASSQPIPGDIDHDCSGKDRPARRCPHARGQLRRRASRTCPPTSSARPRPRRASTAPAWRAADIDEVVMGCIGQVGPDAFNARRVALAAGVPESVPAYTVNRLCGSGLQAVWSAAMQMRWGGVELALAGGNENMSRMPFYDFDARRGHRLGDRALVDGTVAMLTDPFHGVHMGITAENVARKYGISRARAGRVRGRVAAPRGHRRGAGRVRARRSPRSTIGGRRPPPSTPTSTPQPETTLDTLAGLRPAFDEGRHRHRRQRLRHQRRRRRGRAGPRVGGPRAGPDRAGDDRGRRHRGARAGTDGLRPRARRWPSCSSRPAPPPPTSTPSSSTRPSPPRRSR